MVYFPKFRAYWKTEKVMITDISWLRLDQEDLIGRVKGQTTLPVAFNNLILMQSTGLLDKNGVEVFIGDIVRCSQGCLHEVIFIKEFGGMFVGGMPTIYLSDMSEGYAWTGDEEVIGNIYENPELVEEVNDQ